MYTKLHHVKKSLSAYGIQIQIDCRNQSKVRNRIMHGVLTTFLLLSVPRVHEIPRKS